MLKKGTKKLDGVAIASHRDRQIALNELAILRSLEHVHGKALLKVVSPPVPGAGCRLPGRLLLPFIWCQLPATWPDRCHLPTLKIDQYRDAGYPKTVQNEENWKSI